MRARDVAGAVLGLALALVACKRSSLGSDASCGYRPDDWCKSVSGDPCGSHKDSASCSADPRCEGYPYAGESAVGCITDSLCFASNCPTVGCISRCEELNESDCGREEPCHWKGQAGGCTPGEHRCRWDGTRCVRTESCERGAPMPATSSS